MKTIGTYFLFTALLLCSCTDYESLSENTVVQNPKKAVYVQSGNINVNYTDESSFVSGLSSYGFRSPDQVTLNRTASTNNYNQVYGFNIPAANQVTGFKWTSSDEQTADWRPQGITGFNWGGKRFLLATWYGVGAPADNQHKGVRVSLVDITNMNDISYRHILLVQDKNNINDPKLFRQTNDDKYNQLELFAPVTIHGGGVAYQDGKIYVASTSLGIRVFDLNKIIQVSADLPDKNNIGQGTDGSLKAFDYRYILPQTGYYEMVGAKPYSCIALGKDASLNDRLFTGQYKSNSDSGDPKVFGFSIDQNGMVSSQPSPEIVEPKDNSSGNNGPVYRVQGVYRNGNTTIMATTGKSTYQGSTARLVKYYDGASSGSRYRWPHGAEDLYFEQDTGYIWNLTEYETSRYGVDNRCVFAVRYSDYD